MRETDFAARFYAPLLVVLFSLSGCASLSELVQAPGITLANVSLDDFDLNRQSFSLTFDVENPNPFPIPILAVNYAVDLAGQRFAQGASQQSFTVPSNGEGSFSIQINTNLLSSAKSLARIVMAGGQNDIDYALSGDLEVDLPLASALPFEHKGSVQIER